MTVKDRIKVAGSELAKVNIGNAFKALAYPQLQVEEIIASSQYRGNPNAGSFWLFGIDGVDRFFTSDSAASSLKAFKRCTPVSSIILQKAQAFVNGKIWVMNTQGKAKDKEATGEIATKIKKLLTQPNPYQNKSQFESFVYINTMIFGYTVILPNKPNGFENYDAKQLWAVPGNMIEIDEADGVFVDNGIKVIKNIWLTYKNNRRWINPDDVLIIKDFIPSFDSIALPTSRVNLLKDPINNVIGALESRGVLIANRGPRYVVSNAAKDAVGTIAMTPDEKKEVEDDFKQKYGLLRSQSQAIITNAMLNVSSIGYDVKELGLMEEVGESSSMICFGLGFPKFLAGLSDPTFNNQDTAEKALYQRFIIPEATSIYEQWNAWFNTSAYNLNIEKDFTELPILQEDKINLGRSRLYLNQALLIEWQNNLITANEWRVANGNDALPDGDKYYSDWVAEGKTFGNSPVSISVGQAEANGNQNSSSNGNQR